MPFGAARDKIIFCWFNSLKGGNSGVQLVSYAAGKPYLHSSGNTSFCNFYGVQTEPVMLCVINDRPSDVKIFKFIVIDNNDVDLWIDLIYTDFTNSFSYLPVNKFVDKKTMEFGAFLMNMNGYPNPDPKQLFRSGLVDGYRIYGNYMIIRMIQDLSLISSYNEINQIEVQFVLDAEPQK